MTTLRSLKEFRPETECFSAYLERMTIFFAANGIALDKQVPVFLNAIGATMYGLVRSLLAPTNPIEQSLEDIVPALTAHFKPKPLIVVERYHFHKREQASGESAADYVAELRCLASKCKFENVLEDALRDRFVVGLRSESVQKRLLAEAALTLPRAVELAQNMEVVHTNAQVLKSPSALLTVGQVERVSRAPSRSRPTAPSTVGERVQCYCCGKAGHSGGNCRFREAICHKCKTRGHLARVCRGRGAIGSQPQREWEERPQAHRVDSETLEAQHSDEDVILHVNSVGVKTTVAPYIAELELNGQLVTMEIDTGAAVSLISQKTRADLFPNVPLTTPSLRLSTYTAEPIKIVGQMSVAVKYNGYVGNHTLYVVEGSGTTLLGRDWLSKIRMDWASIRSVREGAIALEKLRSKYAEVHV